MSQLKRQIELIEASTKRLVRAMGLEKRDEPWRFIRREAWIHVKLTLRLLWMVRRRKE